MDQEEDPNFTEGNQFHNLKNSKIKLDLPVIDISPGELDCLFDEPKSDSEKSGSQHCLPVYRGRKVTSRPVPKLEIKGEVKAEVRVPRRHLICKPPEETALAGQF